MLLKFFFAGRFVLGNTQYTFITAKVMEWIVGSAEVIWNHQIYHVLSFLIVDKRKHFHKVALENPQISRKMRNSSAT